MSLRKAFLLPLLLSVPVVARAADAAHPDVIAISAVQGPGAQSPMVGQRVTVEGVAVYAGNPGEAPTGLYLQSVKSVRDPKARGAIYVELPPAMMPPKWNQLLRVSGVVAELGSDGNTMTALVRTDIKVVGEVRRPPSEVFPVSTLDAAGLEAREGEVATFHVTVLDSNRLPSRGEIQVSLDGRLFTPTEVAAPGEAAQRIARHNTHRIVAIDDALDPQAKASTWYLPGPVSDDFPLRTGTALQLRGVLVQSAAGYRLLPASPVSIIPHALQWDREPAPEVAGNTRIASLNVLNLFNGDGKQGGFPTPRGADTFEKYQLQQAKLVASVQALQPDVAALMEIENDGTGPDSALAQFVDALNAAGPADDYRFVDSGKGPGSNPIRVALIYRKSRLVMVGDPQILEGGPFVDHSRVPLAQAFRRLVDGKRVGKPFVVVANHFKSKGCGKGEDAAKDADADQKDGQGCWNATRVESAKRVDAWMRSDPTGTRSDRTVLLGDFNAYAMEDPVTTLKAAGWSDALAWGQADAVRREEQRQASLAAKGVQEVNPTKRRIPELYSFVFNGLSGRLDHALLSPALAGKVRGALEWHNNADESDRFGYEGDLAAPGPYRASDHDPILLGFELD